MSLLAWMPPFEISCLVSGIFLSATYRQRLEARIALAVSALNVTWTVVFIWFFGALGAAAATVGASMVNCVVRYVYVRRTIGGVRIAWIWLRPAACAGIMLLAAHLASGFLWGWQLLAAAGGFALGVLLVKPYDAEDRRLLLSVIRR